jgi:Lectin C-type domain
VKTHRFWTTGSNEGVGCEDKWAWCNTKSLLPKNYTRWEAGAPGAPSKERCAQIHFAPETALVGLDDLECSAERYFICKVSDILFFP